MLAFFVSIEYMWRYRTKYLITIAVTYQCFTYNFNFTAGLSLVLYGDLDSLKYELWAVSKLHFNEVCFSVTSEILNLALFKLPKIGSLFKVHFYEQAKLDKIKVTA